MFADWLGAPFVIGKPSYDLFCPRLLSFTDSEELPVRTSNIGSHKDVKCDPAVLQERPSFADLAARGGGTCIVHQSRMAFAGTAFFSGRSRRPYDIPFHEQI